MSSEIRKYAENTLDKKKNLFNARVISFPNDKNLDNSKDLNLDTLDYWKIKDKSNEDQLRAITGICFMFGALILMGLYSNLS
tara:strand:+ start:797 stop:1042 length:246 start_codon:yes stop_codon:yes gene_type:complete